MTGKIALLNVHSSRNVGDAALTEVAIEKLRDQFQNYQVTLVMNDLSSYQGQESTVNSFYNWVYKYNNHLAVRFIFLLIISTFSVVTYRLFQKPKYLTKSMDLQATLDTIFQAQIVASTPGGYLYSYGRGRALIMFAFTLAISLLAGKPLYLLPQSIGPFKNRRERIMIKWILDRARIVMVREVKSLDLIKDLQIPDNKCLLFPDMAFAYRGKPPADAIKWLRSININPDIDRPLLGITMVDWGSQYQGYNTQKQYEVAIAGITRHFIDRYNGNVIMFPQSWGPTDNEDDRIPARRIQSMNSDITESIHLVENPVPANLLKSIYGQMDVFIGTRMHSNIFAMSQYVPVIPIGYLYKTVGIARSAGIENWVIDINDINEERLINKFDELWKMRHQLRKHLEGRIPKLIEQVNEVCPAIAQDFREWIDR